MYYKYYGNDSDEEEFQKDKEYDKHIRLEDEQESPAVIEN